MAILQDRLSRALGASGQGVSTPFAKVNILPEGVRPNVGQAQQQQTAKNVAVSRSTAVQPGVQQTYQGYANPGVVQSASTTTTNYYSPNQYNYAQPAAPISSQTAAYSPQQPEIASAAVASAHKGRSVITLSILSKTSFCLFQ